MSADGTVALDWWFAAEDGKYVAYGTSASGSEESTMYVIEPAKKGDVHGEEVFYSSTRQATLLLSPFGSRSS
jgi:hypothetical protein